MIVEPIHFGFTIRSIDAVLSPNLCVAFRVPAFAREAGAHRAADRTRPGDAGRRFCTDLLVARRERQSGALEPQAGGSYGAEILRRSEDGGSPGDALCTGDSQPDVRRSDPGARAAPWRAQRSGPRG